MKKQFIVLLAPCLMAAGGDGCSPTGTPTNQQVDLYLPDSILSCAKKPRSPGANATNRENAEYIVKLYAVAEDCGGNLDTIRPIYKKWKAKTKDLK